MKILLYITVGIAAYDLYYYIRFSYKFVDAGEVILWSMLADWASVFVFIVFYVFLPFKNFHFLGMGAIPIIAFLGFMVESNIYFNELCDIGSYLTVILMLAIFGFYNTERYFCLGLPLSVAGTIYVWLRVLLTYHEEGFLSYVIGMICFSIQGYLGIKYRRELMAEKYNSKKAFEDWKNVLDLCQEGVVICRNGKVVYCNKGLEYFFEKTEKAETDIAACIDRLFEDTDITSEDGKLVLWSGLANLKDLFLEKKCFVHDKSKTLLFTLSMRKLVIENEETFLLFITRPSLEEQTHARFTENKYSRLMISTITHDLKLPITVIENNLELLSQYIEEKGMSYFKSLQISAQSFEYYIYDLVDYNMMLEDAFVLSNDRIYPENLVQKLEEIAKPKAELKSLKFNIKFANTLPLQIYSDFRRLVQVLLNLCFNSIKYTFGGVDIIFEFKTKRRELSIKVIDTGIGISSSELEQINRLFGLLDRKLIRNETGIGLGLMVSKGIIKAMNGRIKIISKTGIGTTCKIRIPIDGISPMEIKEDNEPNKDHSERSDSNLFLSSRCLRRLPSIMVVDDEPFVQLALGTILTKLGCIVDKASNGKMSVEMVLKKIDEGEKYDLIFMDANMPIMSGYEAAQIISNDTRVGTPIVCVSAQDSAQHRKKCTECGMHDILSKPCSASKLKEILKKYKLV